MRCLSITYRLVIGTVVLSFTACASLPPTSPFPTVDTRSPIEQAYIIQARTTGLRTLAAVLTVALSRQDKQDAFEMIVNYDASGKMRFTAFKDLMLSTRPIFDLIFVGPRYRLTLHNEAGIHVRQGQVSQFVKDHPEFRVFFLVGEAFFLPGYDGSGNPPVPANAQGSQFITRLKSGLKAQWSAKPDTLEITKARLDGNRAAAPVSFLLSYSDYRKVETYYIPGHVKLIDPHLGLTTQAWVKQVEINTPLVQGVFDLSSFRPPPLLPRDTNTPSAHALYAPHGPISRHCERV